MDSEVELNDILQEMHIVATQPELYPILVELNAVQSILGLLSHENTGAFCGHLRFLPGFLHSLHELRVSSISYWCWSSKCIESVFSRVPHFIT